MFEYKESKDYEFEGPEIILDSDCDAEALRKVLYEINYSRHFSEVGNEIILNYLVKEGHGAGYAVPIYAQAYNSLEWIFPEPNLDKKKIIAGGTHYDTVENCPGADDNGSGIALLICAARYLQKHKDKLKAHPHFYFFNREEDGLLGSDAFVREVLSKRQGSSRIVPDEVHIMEMVGYTAGSQQTPPGLPDFGPVGDFLGIVGEGIVDSLVEAAGKRVEGLKVKGLDIPFSLAQQVGDSLRSDHTPFWNAGYKVCMYTDTSHFRNPHYHQITDTPETLDFEFMEKVLKLFLTRFF